MLAALACLSVFAFGDGALTYPSGGIPLTAGKLGTPNQIRSLIITSPASADGLTYKYDQANNKIRIYKSTAAHTHSLFLNNADVADSAGARINAGTNLLGANTGSDITVAGVTVTSGGGGILQVAASASDEMATSVAPAATTLYVSVSGW